MENCMRLKLPTTGLGLPSCLFMILAISFMPHFVGEALAAKKGEVINTAPDSNTAGLLNTEVAPEGSFQFDLSTGHLWYGSSAKSNIFGNIYLAGLTLVGTPILSLGGKARYCETLTLSCSLLGEVAVGARLLGEKQKRFGTLFQNSIAYDMDSAGRMTFGIGLAFLADRAVDLTTVGFEDQLYSWLNFLYDVPIETDWSVGLGFSPTLMTLHQFPVSDNLFVNRTGFSGTALAHVRTQYSTGNWQFSGGGALLSEAGSWSLWPVVEVIWRKPESLFVDEAENRAVVPIRSPANSVSSPGKSPKPVEQATPIMVEPPAMEIQPAIEEVPGTEVRPSPAEYEQ